MIHLIDLTILFAVPSSQHQSSGGIRGFLNRLRKASGNVMGNGSSGGHSPSHHPAGQGSASARTNADKSPRMNTKNNNQVR